MYSRNWELTCVHGVGHSAEPHGCEGCCGVFLPLKDIALDEVKAKLDKLEEKRIQSSNLYNTPYSQTISFTEVRALINSLYNTKEI
jgi:hypothetical protein